MPKVVKESKIYNEIIQTGHGHSWKCANPDCDNEIDMYKYDLKRYIYKFYIKDKSNNTKLVYCCGLNCMNKMEKFLNHRHYKR